jgi:formate-dependent nitrite reductase membrane component NrfD
VPAKKPINPFYIAALPVGVLFAITACAFVVMTMQGLDPQRAEQTGLIRLMARWGVAIMVGELVVLGLLTIAAIGTDDFWTRRCASRESDHTTS